MGKPSQGVARQPISDTRAAMELGGEVRLPHRRDGLGGTRHRAGGVLHDRGQGPRRAARGMLPTGPPVAALACAGGRVAGALEHLQEVAAEIVQICPTPGRVRPNSVEFVRNRAIVQMSASMANFHQIRSNSAPHGPELARCLPNSTTTKIGPISAKFSPEPAKFDQQMLTEFEQIRPDKFGLRLATFGRNRAGNCQHFAIFGQIWPEFGQNWAAW